MANSGLLTNKSMNYKYIIGLIALIAAIGAVWTWQQSPDRQMRPAQPIQQQQQMATTSEADLAEVYGMVICPEPECTQNGESLAICDCETSLQIKGQIKTMMAQGLTKEGVLSHLKLMGMVPGDPGLPPGHPPIGGGTITPDTSQTKLPPDHPPIGGM